MRAHSLVMAAGLALCWSAVTTAQQVEIETSLGTIVIELYPDSAPVTVANFLRYVDEHRLGEASFYRVVTPDNQPGDSIRIEVIQGGLGRDRQLALPPIPHETTEVTGLRHVDGTVSMARLAPGSATSEIFIVLGSQPELDYGGRRHPDRQGFAAFGRVVSGMEVVRAIQARPADGQMLRQPVAITRVSRVGSPPDSTGGERP